MFSPDLSAASTLWLFDEISTRERRRDELYSKIRRGVIKKAEQDDLYDLEEELQMLRATLESRRGDSEPPSCTSASGADETLSHRPSSTAFGHGSSQADKQDDQLRENLIHPGHDQGEVETESEASGAPDDNEPLKGVLRRQSLSDSEASVTEIRPRPALSSRDRNPMYPWLPGSAEGSPLGSREEQHGVSPPYWGGSRQMGPVPLRPSGGEFSGAGRGDFPSDVGFRSNENPVQTAPRISSLHSPFPSASSIGASSHHSHQPSAHNSTAVNDSFPNESFEIRDQRNSRKRLLSSPTTYRDGQRQKQLRQSPSPIDSRSNTPGSQASASASNIEIPDFLREFLSPEEAQEQLRQLRRLERERAQRLEREREDEAFARLLQAEFDRGDVEPSSSSAAISASNPETHRYQSYINNSGGLRRGALQNSSPVAERPSAQHSNPAAWNEPDAESSVYGLPGHNAPQGIPTSSRAPVSLDLTSSPIYRINVDDSSDSDLSLLPLDTYIEPRDLRPDILRPPADNQRPASTQTGSTSWSSLPPILGRDRSAGWTYPFDSQYDLHNDEDTGLVRRTLEGLRRVGMDNNQPSLLSQLGDAASSFLPSFNFDDYFPGPAHHIDIGPPNHSGYYGDHTDPREKAKEIKELMNNIRPDGDLGLSDRTGSPEDMAEGCGLYEHQKLGLGWMIQMEEGTNKGGILADDMGLGKTIQAIALMVSRRSDNPEEKTTLIIAPLALLRQWETEIMYKVRPEKRLKTYIYHGAKKNSSFKQLKAYDVVLTTYGTLGAEFSRMDRYEMMVRHDPNTPEPHLPLLGRHSRFHRVILDEAQNIKNKTTKAFKAASHLQAKTRFCMTGTPMMNNVGELWSLISFLRIRPYNDWRRFQNEIQGPLRESSATVSENAMRRLQALLKAILLRRTKKSTINGQPILSLPEKTTAVEHVVMEGDQLEFYKALESQTQIRFNRYLRAGTVGKNYHGVLLLLLRLRQACCHPHLIRNDAEAIAGTVDKSADELEQIAREHLSPDAIKRLLQEGQVDCPICMDAVENSTIFTPCGHATCSECFTRISDPSQAVEDGTDTRPNKFKCMNCRGLVDSTKVTDWNAFRKVYLESEAAKKDSDDDLESDDDVSEESDSDESNTDSESGSDDESGSMADFIVDDEAVEDQHKPRVHRARLVVKAEPRIGAVSSSSMLSPTEEAQEKNHALSVRPTVVDEESPTSFDLPEHASSSKQQMGKNSKEKAKSKKKDKVKRKRKGKAKAKGTGNGKEKLDIKLKNPTLSELQKESKRNLKARRLYFEKLREEFVSSAKLDRCISILEHIGSKGSGEKTIVFSQFTTFLDLLEVPLTERNWHYRRYDGSMKVKDRDEAVLEFTRRPRCRIMLVSLKAGNSGLNLTAANNVIMLDPFWNPYIEQQAIDRVHRIGQRLPVTCYRILIQGTVEDRIMNIQERKRKVVDGALDENASRGIARLDQRDLAYLFGVTN